MLGRLVSSVMLFFCCSSVHAAMSLQDRLSAFQTLSAEFTQSTTSNGHLNQMKGIIKIKRPNHFYWKVNQPDEQEIVSDGQKIWQYEPDLSQVIVRKVDQELQGVPLMLLSGKVSDIQDIFTIEARGEFTFELTPKSEDQVVKKVVIVFESNHLSSLIIDNSLGQEVTIMFDHVEQNQPLDDLLFEFTIPKGVEVLEQ